MRAIVEDSNDPNLIAYTLDSDGKHNVNATKTSDPDFKNVSDGTWHMVTITTHTDRTRGFLLYVDGQMAGKAPIMTLPPHMLCLANAQSLKLFPWSCRSASRLHLW